MRYMYNNYRINEKILSITVLDDLQLMMKMHFTTLKTLAQEDALPIVQQNQKQRTRSASRPGGSGYPPHRYGQVPSSQSHAPPVGQYGAPQQSYNYSRY